MDYSIPRDFAWKGLYHSGAKELVKGYHNLASNLSELLWKQEEIINVIIQPLDNGDKTTLLNIILSF